MLAGLAAAILSVGLAVGKPGSDKIEIEDAREIACPLSVHGSAPYSTGTTRNVVLWPALDRTVENRNQIDTPKYD
ncbi:hypothetical protein HB780_09490 (plasmid) [Rhizobium lusitanum]|uniref:hypothetical protein n=1 Tax=Rhizobium lusitanum TaxID=293958 RepID=UPI001607C262|nr:hypothetical protein [Rhizobium lusitanum]QND45937.1 hypothetical protein HB780_09490 [Rhizobium lusitanum]